MNDPNALRPMTIEKALPALPGASYDEAGIPVSARWMSLPHIWLRRFGWRPFQASDAQSRGFHGEEPSTNLSGRWAKGRRDAGAGRPLGGPMFAGGPPFEEAMPRTTEDINARIKRITCQVSRVLGDRPARALLAVTERILNDASPSSVRFAGENAAPTTSDVADPGELSVGKDP